MRSIYVAATGQHVGKTTIALGLLAALRARGVKCHYFKPVGQHFTEQDGSRADDDAWLCREVIGNDVDAELMSPLVIPPGYVADYLESPSPEPLKARILEAEKYLKARSDCLIIEGTGHAGVGSCLDLSNAAVASMLNAVALMVVPGGIGRSLDEVALSLNLFGSCGVTLAGIIANKVYRDKFDRVTKSLRIGLERLGTSLLGAIPYEPELAYPTVGQIRSLLSARLLCGEAGLDNVVRSNVIAAMTPQNVLRYLEVGSLVITPGDRVDNILLAISAESSGDTGASRKIAGIVLTGGFVPHSVMMPLLKSSGLPVLLCEQDTFSVSSRISSRVFKINPGDTEKIEAAQSFVREHVDLDMVLPLLEEK